MAEDLKLLKSFNRELEAEMAKEMLENEGIPAMVVADDCAGMYPQFQTQSKGVRLLVAPEDLERARDILGIMGVPD